MATSKLIGLLFEAWNDMDRVVDGVSTEQAQARVGGGSSFAWTFAHVTNQVDAWVNVRFAGHAPHPLIGQEEFRIGGTGVVSDWETIRQSAGEVQSKARRYLDGRTDDDLALVLPYDGSFLVLREKGLSLRHALLRISAHHFFHIGEIATKRDQLGHRVGDYPGALTQTI